MTKEFLEELNKLAKAGEAFAVATVVRTEGSTSAKAGSKMIIRNDGSVHYGWVGGGCAESMVLEAALNSIKDGEPRHLNLSMEDEVSGTGMPCGGNMDVYVESYIPKPKLLIIGHGRIAEVLTRVGKLMGFEVTVNDSQANPTSFPEAEKIVSDDMDLSKLDITPWTYAVILTMHKSDDRILGKVLNKGARYIGLVASRNRTKIVFRYLLEDGVSMETLSSVKAPAGLDIGAKTPEEIALSIMAEIIEVRRGGGTGGPLSEVKKVSLEELEEGEPLPAPSTGESTTISGPRC